MHVPPVWESSEAFTCHTFSISKKTFRGWLERSYVDGDDVGHGGKCGEAGPNFAENGRVADLLGLSLRVRHKSPLNRDRGTRGASRLTWPEPRSLKNLPMGETVNHMSSRQKRSYSARMGFSLRRVPRRGADEASPAGVSCRFMSCIVALAFQTRGYRTGKVKKASDWRRERRTARCCYH